MDNIKNAVEGKKTYTIAIVLVVYAVISVYLGKMDLQEAIVIVLNGLGLGTVRSAIK